MKSALALLIFGMIAFSIIQVSLASSFPNASEGDFLYSNELPNGKQLIWDVNKFNISYENVSPNLYPNSVINLTILQNPNNKVFSSPNEIFDPYMYFNLNFDGVPVKSVWQGSIEFPYTFWHGGCEGSCWDVSGGFTLRFLWLKSFQYYNGTDVDMFDLMEDSVIDNEYITYGFSNDRITIDFHRENFSDITVIDRSSGIMLERSGSFYTRLKDDTVWYYNFDIELRKEENEDLITAPQITISASIFVLTMVLRRKRALNL